MKTFAETAGGISTAHTAETRSNGATNRLPCVLNRTFLYRNPRGLHARPAALLVKSLSDFQCVITAELDGEQVNAKSILGLLCLAVSHQSKVSFTASGQDAPEAMATLEALFASQLVEN